jgi:hypothetical protein
VELVGRWGYFVSQEIRYAPVGMRILLQGTGHKSGRPGAGYCSFGGPLLRARELQRTVLDGLFEGVLDGLGGNVEPGAPGNHFPEVLRLLTIGGRVQYLLN